MIFTTSWYKCQANSSLPHKEATFMDKKEFQYFRQKLQKTQKEMAQLLGTSLKAVESYEQGWRNIPVQVERQVLFFLALKMETCEQPAPCWEIRHCTHEMQKSCPAYEFNSGHLCWFINGTICQGKLQANWKQKMTLCKKCKVFTPLMDYWGLPTEHRTVHGRKKGGGGSLKR
jgi:DNA-binding XRE family transcriptional regulator